VDAACRHYDAINSFLRQGEDEYYGLRETLIQLESLFEEE
jgi:flagellar biosynthesis/type III secretory pathway ATPase